MVRIVMALTIMMIIPAFAFANMVETEGEFYGAKFSEDGQQLWLTDYSEETLKLLEAQVNSQGEIFSILFNEGENDYSIQALDELGNINWVYNSDEEFKQLVCDDAGSAHVAQKANEGHFRVDKIANDGSLAWSADHVEASIGITYPGDIILDGSGNIYVTGDAYIAESADDEVERYLYLIKFNSDGDFQWLDLYVYEEDSTTCGRHLALDGDSNPIIAGFTRNEAFNWHLIVLKYLPDGTRVWETAYSISEVKRNIKNDRTSGYSPEMMAIDSNNNVIVVGIDNDSEEDYAALIVKYDSSGNFVWDDLIDQSGNDVFNAVAVLPDDSIVAGGYLSEESKGLMAFLVKYAEDGEQEWLFTYPDTGDWTNGSIHTLTADASGNFFAGGTACETKCASLFFKCDENGDVIWDATFYPEPLYLESYLETIRQLPSGDLFVGGFNQEDSYDDDTYNDDDDDPNPDDDTFDDDDLIDDDSNQDDDEIGADDDQLDDDSTVDDDESANDSGSDDDGNGCGC